jgi:hypothetical protein
MADIGWRRRRGSSPAARTGARQRAGLTPASASNTLFTCQRETLHSIIHLAMIRIMLKRLVASSSS